MEMVRNIVAGGLIGTAIVIGACVGIVGGSLVLCGLSMVGLWIAGG